jgi:hypothetical protein
MKIRPNGWQRLWIVTSVLWLVGVSIMNYNMNYNGYKNDAEVYHAWSNEILEYLITQVPDLKGSSVSSLRRTYSDFSERELIEVLHKTFITKHPAYEYGLTEIDSKYENKVTLRAGWGLSKLFIWILLAIGVPASLYVFGWAIAWIRNGFNRA